MSAAEIDLDLTVADTHSRHNASTEDMGAHSIELMRACSQRMYHEYQWKIPMPKVPAAPMLFRPDVLRDVFSSGSTVMHSEVDAMKTGILEAIPLVYFPVAPGDVRKALLASSAASPAVLDPKDAELLDTDIDADLLEKRAMPSLTLLKRPLYTEIGLTSVNERHNERLSKLIPAHLLARASTTEAGLDLQRSLSAHRGSFSQSQSAEQQRRDGVCKSFKYAKSVDVAFQEMLKAVREEKLGLGGALSELESSQLTRQFWEGLFHGTTGAQQRRIWVAVCRHVLSVLKGAAVEEDFSLVTSTELVAEIERLRLPYGEVFWPSWCAQFSKVLAEVDVSRSLALLNIRPLDFQTPVNSREQEVFKAAISVPNPLKRTSGRIIDPADNRSRLTAFPVSVCPILPSGFDEVVDLLDHGTDVRTPLIQGALASRYESLSQLVIQGVRDALPRKTAQQACAEPHMLVNGNLMIADEVVQRRGGTGAVSPGMTISTHTSGNLVFDEYLTTDADTSTLLMELHPSVCLYDRVSIRREFRRQAGSNAPASYHFVVCFDDEVDTPLKSRGTPPQKRPRDEE